MYVCMRICTILQQRFHDILSLLSKIWNPCRSRDGGGEPPMFLSSTFRDDQLTASLVSSFFRVPPVLPDYVEASPGYFISLVHFYYIFWNTRTIKQLYPRCHDPIPKLAITKVHFNIGRSQPTDYISVFFLNQLAEPLTQNCDLMVMLWYPDCLTDAQLIKMQFKRGTNCAKFHGAEIRAFLSCAQGQLYSQFRNAVKPVFFSASRNPAVTYLLPPGLTLVHGTRSLPVVHSAARSHTTWLCSLLPSPVQCPVFSESSLWSKS